MEKFTAVLLPFLLLVLLIRLLTLPIKLIWKGLIHSACGFVCLWLFNSIAPFTGFYIPLNLVTVLVAGVLGLPGIGVLTLVSACF